MRHRWLVIIAVVAAGCASKTPPSPTEAVDDNNGRIGAVIDGPGEASSGAELFRANCSPCHGREGRGDGPAAEGLEVPPRDLTSGRFKFRSTRPGQPPTDGDLYRTISQGVPGTAMPPWRRQLEEDAIWDVVQFVKRLSPAFDGTSEREVVRISEPPEPTQDSVEKGEVMYELYGCGTCHGFQSEQIRLPTLTDDRGRRIEATQFAGERFAGGSNPRDVYRCIAVGIGGTPMPAFHEALQPNQIWHLVHYVRSLGD